eukprot:gene2786-50117_t
MGRGSPTGGCREADGCATQCADPTEVAPVRCCSSTFISGWNKRCGDRDVWHESDRWPVGCQQLTHGAAAAFCASQGGRLCTADEFAA